ncbi:glycerol-3-phosphate acyltransferase [Sporosarcina sp. FA9]|uniref:glycerol-3-phosphate acyltransferase n=1 Tax=Sporosarcina sp. FA9 TaxID=3413030 RepID=UPI003F65E13E
MIITLLLLIIGSYLLGNILTATIISNLFYKEKISGLGSGNPGARNVGRVFGKTAFIATFIGDALKGVLAVLTVRWLGLEPTIEVIALLAVMLGHIYPVFFRFRGGQGISTFIGGLLALNPLVFIVFVCIFVIIYLFIRSFTIAGLSAITLVPIIIVFYSIGTGQFIVASLISVLLLFVHKDDLKEKFLKEGSE